MEREAIDGRSADFVGKIKRFVEDEVLKMPIFDTFVIATILGTALFLKDEIDARKTGIKNDFIRVRDSRREIAPLNPLVIKEIEYIVESKF